MVRKRRPDVAGWQRRGGQEHVELKRRLLFIVKEIRRSEFRFREFARTVGGKSAVVLAEKKRLRSKKEKLRRFLKRHPELKEVAEVLLHDVFPEYERAITLVERMRDYILELHRLANLFVHIAAVSRGRKKKSGRR